MKKSRSSEEESEHGRTRKGRKMELRRHSFWNPTTTTHKAERLHFREEGMDANLGFGADRAMAERGRRRGQSGSTRR